MAGEIEVEIRGIPLVSKEEWAQAQSEPIEARREFAWELARQRMKRQGQSLATKLKEVAAYPLRYLVWDGSRMEWIAVPEKSNVHPVSLATDLVDRVTGWGTQKDFEELAKAFDGFGAVA
jgi:hypothetical protein